MDYKVAVTADAEADLDQYIQYLLAEKKSEQAAVNLLSNRYFLLYRIVDDIVFLTAFSMSYRIMRIR